MRPPRAWARLRGRPAAPSASLAAWRRRRRRGTRIRLLVLVCLVGLLVGGGSWLLLFSPYLTAREVAVSGEHDLTAARIRKVAAVDPDRPLARVDLAAVRARVEQIPAVARADVARNWPHTVHVTVVERTPVAVVDRGGDEGMQGVDPSGVVFGHFEHRPARLPLIRTSARISTRALAQAARVAAALPARLRHRVDHVLVRSPDEIDLQLRDGRKVRWGSAAHSDLKARVARALLKRDVQQVDVTVPERPTTRS